MWKIHVACLGVKSYGVLQKDLTPLASLVQAGKRTAASVMESERGSGGLSGCSNDSDRRDACGC